MDWGARIKQYRAFNGVTQQALADGLGVDRTTISRWENGRDEPALIYRRRLKALTLTYQEGVKRGLIDFIDSLEGIATLLDAKFRVVRTSRTHQSLLKYDVSEVYGKSCERYWSGDMEAIIKGIGGLRNYYRNGIYRLDLTVVRQPREGGFDNEQPLVSVGRTVAIGDPRDPIGHLTTVRLADPNTPRSPPVIVSLDDTV